MIILQVIMNDINILRDQLVVMKKVSNETTARLLAFDSKYGNHPQLSDEQESKIYSVLYNLSSQLVTATKELQKTIQSLQ